MGAPKESPKGSHAGGKDHACWALVVGAVVCRDMTKVTERVSDRISAITVRSFPLPGKQI